MLPRAWRTSKRPPSMPWCLARAVKSPLPRRFSVPREPRFPFPKEIEGKASLSTLPAPFADSAAFSLPWSPFLPFQYQKNRGEGKNLHSQHHCYYYKETKLWIGAASRAASVRSEMLPDSSLLFLVLKSGFCRRPKSRVANLSALISKFSLITLSLSISLLQSGHARDAGAGRSPP